MNHSDSQSRKVSSESYDATEAALGWVHREGMSDSVIAGLETNKRRRFRRNMVGATAAFALLMVVGVMRYQPTIPAVQQDVRSSTVAVMASSEMKLPDGSIVQLKNDAELIPAYTPGRRTVILLKGTAYFKVTKDQNRPFIVVARQVGVRAVGTAFSVELVSNLVEVLVTEGRVAVSPEADFTDTNPSQLAPAMLSGGEQVSIDTSASIHMVNQSMVHAISDEVMADRMSWRIPRLEFSGTSLEEVVMMFNRHNQQQLILGDADLADLKLSGLLRANNIQALLSILKNQFQVQADYTEPDQIILRSRI